MSKTRKILMCESHEMQLYEMIDKFPVDHSSERILMKEHYNVLTRWIDKEYEVGVTPAHTIEATINSLALNLAILLRVISHDEKVNAQLASDFSVRIYRTLTEMLETVSKWKHH